MANFSTFEYGTGIVYGPSSFSVTLLTNNVVRFELDSLFIVVDNEYKNVENYQITPDGSTATLRIRKVLAPKNDLVVNFVDVLVDPPVEGVIYLAQVQNLRYRAGGTLSAGGYFKARNTKASLAQKSLPGHFSKDPEHNIAALVSAIGISDDLIGGSRDDTFG